MTRIVETTGMSVTVMDLYANPTIASFVDQLGSKIHLDVPVDFTDTCAGLRKRSE